MAIYFLFKSRQLAALCGSWMGGTGYMVVIQGALNIADADMGYTLFIDSIDYSIWVMMLLWLVLYAAKFNRWTKSDTSVIDQVGAELTKHQESMRQETTFSDMVFLLGSAYNGNFKMGIWLPSQIGLYVRNHLDRSSDHSGRGDLCNDSHVASSGCISDGKYHALSHCRAHSLKG